MSLFKVFNSGGFAPVERVVRDAASGIVGNLGAKLGSASGGLLGGINQAISASASDSSTFYKVYIFAQTGNDQYITLVADCPSEFTFATEVEYEAPYQNLIEDRLGPISEVSKFFGTKLLTQALTAKVWSGASDTTISLPLVFQAVNDADEDVLKPLAQLMYLSMPREELRGGFLSSPGPRFDTDSVVGVLETGIELASSITSKISAATKENTNQISSMIDTAKGVLDNPAGAAKAGVRAASSLLKSGNQAVAALSNSLKKGVKNPISLRIGNYLNFDNVVIENVQQIHTVNPVGDLYGQSSGINSTVTVEVTFKTFFTLTQRDLLDILIPAANGRAPKTRAKLDELLR